MEGKKIKTINGVEVFEDACRLIDGKYYIIGNVNVEDSGDVYEINGRFVRIEADRLVFNQTAMKYELKNQTMATKGYVYYDQYSKQFKEGYFEFNELYDFYVITEKNEKIAVYSKCMMPNSYKEYLRTGDFYHISTMKAKEFGVIAPVEKRFKESFPYNSQGHTETVTKTFEANYKPLYNKNVLDISKLMKDLSFGLEFETTKGIIPNAKAKALPLLPLRDGSIEGLEYVTVPLTGSLGLQALVDSVEELGKRTTYDSSCSLHIHIGNIPRTPEFTLALFKLYSVFSDEIYRMFPHYKKDNLGVKRKNYSEPYNLINLLGRMDNKISSKDEVTRNFSVLFDYLAEVNATGMNFARYANKLENVENHPRDPGGEAKWNIHHRYHVVNFIPLLFVNKATVEFRIHTPTYDPNKILYFMTLCSAIINTAIKDTKSILANFGGYMDQRGLNRDRNVNRFLSDYIHSSEIRNKGSISDDVCSYFENRISFSEGEHKRGKISYDEDDLRTRFSVDFKRKMNVSKNNKQAEEEPKLIKSLSKKPYSVSKKIMNKSASGLSNDLLSNNDKEIFQDIEYDLPAFQTISFQEVRNVGKEIHDVREDNSNVSSSKKLVGMMEQINGTQAYKSWLDNTHYSGPGINFVDSAGVKAVNAFSSSTEDNQEF